MRGGHCRKPEGDPARLRAVKDVKAGGGEI